MQNSAGVRRTNPKWVTNLSDRVISDIERIVLEKGLHYAIPNRKFDVPQFIGKKCTSVSNMRGVTP